MALIVETDLKEILNRIDQKIDNVQKDVTDLKISVTELKGEIKTVDERLSGQINILDTKIDGLSTRVQNQEFTSRVVLGSLLLIMLGGAAKMFNFLPSGTRGSA
jgi:lipid II:glycine glycyltransferase (peptidoglycan interpeptide bridge formation enzyme)